MGLEQKVAIVTGAGSGIGRAVALRLSADGARVVVNDLKPQLADRVASEIVNAGGQAGAVALDVSTADGPFELVRAAIGVFGRLDVMVANAGIAIVKPLMEHRPDDLDRLFAVNAFGVLYCIQAAAHQFIAQGGGGKIINAASIAGHRGFPNFAGYAATKHAVVAFTQTAAIELAPHGITVNAYCPGIVDTGMWDDISSGLGTSKEEAFAEYGDGIALGRLQTSEDVAGLVSYLASSDADYMTGQSINIDGGILFQ